VARPQQRKSLSKDERRRTRLFRAFFVATIGYVSILGLSSNPLAQTLADKTTDTVANTAANQRWLEAQRDCGELTAVDWRAAHPANRQYALRSTDETTAALELTEILQNRSMEDRRIARFLDLWQQAHATDDPATQCQLGALLADFEDPRLLVEAARWFRRSALRGHPYAQFHLGVLFASGEGVAKSGVEAKVWLELATYGPLDASTRAAATAIASYLDLPLTALVSREKARPAETTLTEPPRPSEAIAVQSRAPLGAPPSLTPVVRVLQPSRRWTGRVRPMAPPWVARRTPRPKATFQPRFVPVPKFQRRSVPRR